LPELQTADPFPVVVSAVQADTKEFSPVLHALFEGKQTRFPILISSSLDSTFELNAVSHELHKRGLVHLEDSVEEASFSCAPSFMVSISCPILVRIA
jgi:hypothetical protein